jgi:hypothetical protein
LVNLSSPGVYSQSEVRVSLPNTSAYSSYIDC